MIEEEYPLLDPLAQRSVHVLTHLGRAFPECATLETICRTVVRTKAFDPEQAMSIFKRFQWAARGAGQPVLIQGSLMLAFMPHFNSEHMTVQEGDLLKLSLSLLPPLIFASTKASSAPQLFKPDGGPRHTIEQVSQMARQYHKVLNWKKYPKVHPMRSPAEVVNEIEKK